MESTSRACSTCRCEKPLTEFPRNRKQSLGHGYECLECKRQRSRAYRAANRERVREAGRSHYAANRERIAQQLRERRASDQVWAEERRDRTRQWSRANPDKRYAKYQRYINRRRALPYEDVDRMALYDRDGGRCHLCGKRVPRDAFHLDHLIPVSAGGGYLASNLRVAHPRCNMRRGAGRLPAQLLLVA